MSECAQNLWIQLFIFTSPTLLPLLLRFIYLCMLISFYLIFLLYNHFKISCKIIHSVWTIYREMICVFCESYTTLMWPFSFHQNKSHDKSPTCIFSLFFRFSIRIPHLLSDLIYHHLILLNVLKLSEDLWVDKR